MAGPSSVTSSAQHHAPVHPYVPLVVGVLAASSASILVRFAQRDAPSLVIAAYRLTIATLFLLPWVIRRWEEEIATLPKRLIALTLLSGVFLTAHFATWITSLEYTSVASSVVLVQTSPIMVALLSPFLLKETLRPRTWLGIGLAFMGSVLVSMSDICLLPTGGLVCPSLASLLGGTALRGDLLALSGAVAVSGYLIIGRRIRGEITLLPYLFGTYGTSAVLLILVSALAGLPFHGYQPQTYVWFFLLALLPQTIAHSTVNWALRYLPAAIVSIFLLGEPVGSAILAVFILDEIPPPLRIFGGGLILAGIALTVASQRTTKVTTVS